MAGVSIHPCSLECIGTCRTSCLKMWIGSRLFEGPERHCGAPTRSMGLLMSLQNPQHPRNLESSRRKSNRRANRRERPLWRQDSDKTYYRVYAKYFDWVPSVDMSGAKAHDGWSAVRGGFRMDSRPSRRDSLTLQGDLYHSRYDETLTIPSLTLPYSSTFPNNGSYGWWKCLGPLESYFFTVHDVPTNVL